MGPVLVGYRVEFSFEKLRHACFREGGRDFFAEIKSAFDVEYGADVGDVVGEEGKREFLFWVDCVETVADIDSGVIQTE